MIRGGSDNSYGIRLGWSKGSFVISNLAWCVTVDSYAKEILKEEIKFRKERKSCRENRENREIKISHPAILGAFIRILEAACLLSVGPYRFPHRLPCMKNYFGWRYKKCWFVLMFVLINKLSPRMALIGLLCNKEFKCFIHYDCYHCKVASCHLIFISTTMLTK